MPLALALVYNDKNRSELAVIRSAEYRTCMLPDITGYESFPSSKDDTHQYLSWETCEVVKKQFRDRVLYSVEDIVTIHLRAASGQTANPNLRTGTKLTREYINSHPNYKFLVHATIRNAMNSIEKNNLKPMGRRDGAPRPTHFVPFDFMEHMRLQTDCIIIYSGYTLLNCQDVYVTSNGYVQMYDKEGIPLKSAIMTYDIYNQQFWYSTYGRRYHAPVTQLYEYMTTPKANARPETANYADLFQYMRIYCEYKWMTFADHSQGLDVGPFESYRKSFEKALKDPEHIENWKTATYHPGLGRSYEQPQPRTPPMTQVNLLDLAHQATSSDTPRSTPRDQGPVRPKQMPKSTPKPPPNPPKAPPKPSRPAPSPPAPTPHREMPKELTKEHDAINAKGKSLTRREYTTSTVSVPVGR